MLRRILFGLAIVGAVLVNVAATGSSQADAIAIATVMGFALPFLYKYLPQVGHYMVAITVVASALTAVAAELYSGEFE